MADTTVDEVSKKLREVDGDRFSSNPKTRNLVIANLKQYIDTLGDLNKLKNSGDTLLHKYLGEPLLPVDIDIINYLIYDKGLDVNATDNKGRTVFVCSTGLCGGTEKSLVLLQLLSRHPKVDLNKPFPDGTTVADFPGSQFYEIIKPEADKRGVVLVPGIPEVLKNLQRNVGLATKLGREDANAGKSMNQEIIKNYRQKFPQYDQVVSQYMNAYSQTMMAKKGGKSRRRSKTAKSKKYLKKSKKTRRH